MTTFNSLEISSNEFNSLIATSRFTNGDGQNLTQDQGTRAALDILYSARESAANVYVIGNGGSAAVASHIVTDFSNVCGLRAITLHEPSVLTCFCNDFGYENGYAKRMHVMARKDDVLIAVSSSGQSKNILNAVDVASEAGASVITLSGFSAGNPLRHMGEVNYWVNSHTYGLVEIAHLFALHYWSDCIAMELKQAREIA